MDKPRKTVQQLSTAELQDALGRVVNLLWREYPEREPGPLSIPYWNSEKEWDQETIQSIANNLACFGLQPESDE